MKNSSDHEKKKNSSIRDYGLGFRDTKNSNKNSGSSNRTVEAQISPDCHFWGLKGLLFWVAVKELKLSYHNG